MRIKLKGKIIATDVTKRLSWLTFDLRRISRKLSNTNPRGFSLEIFIFTGAWPPLLSMQGIVITSLSWFTSDSFIFLVIKILFFFFPLRCFIDPLIHWFKSYRYTWIREGGWSTMRLKIAAVDIRPMSCAERSVIWALVAIFSAIGPTHFFNRIISSPASCIFEFFERKKERNFSYLLSWSWVCFSFFFSSKNKNKLPPSRRRISPSPPCVKRSPLLRHVSLCSLKDFFFFFFFFVVWSWNSASGFQF